MQQINAPVYLSSWKCLALCAGAALLVVLFGQHLPLSPAVLAVQVVTTVLCLFVFGSIRYRIDKNALTYGAMMIISATFWQLWWSSSALKLAMANEGVRALIAFVHRHFFTLRGLDKLVHADTMLFILGLTLFVAVIAQTRLLETISLVLLKRNRGKVLPTVAAIMAVVSFASGILDGVSMIGLMIRILIMILFFAKVRDAAALYAVMISTVVTTVCGMWLAYGEPPNLIMKSNLHPHLDNAFFLRYCMPAAVGSYLIVYWNVRRMLRGTHVQLAELDILDHRIADVRFLQASRHGEVLIPAEFVDEHREMLGDRYATVDRRLHQGEPLGVALIREGVPADVRKKLLGMFLDERLAADLDDHYQHVVDDQHEERQRTSLNIFEALQAARRQRVRTQVIGGLAFLPFIGLLIAHAINHDIPLFYASFAGFAVASIGILAMPRIRQIALKDAKHEYSEYLFLFPLFFSITLLQKTGFFDHLSQLLYVGIDKLGIAVMGYAQFAGTAFLSAVLDNNVVADFAGRALRGLPIAILHLFAMAQIAGYAVGGCWTHIGSAQSVVAYSFIRREMDSNFTPFSWMKAMTPIILEIFVLMTVIVWAEAALSSWLQ